MYEQTLSGDREKGLHEQESSQKSTTKSDTYVFVQIWSSINWGWWAKEGVTDSVLIGQDFGSN